MWREPKPKRALTSTGYGSSSGSSSGSQLAGDGIPRSSKKTCARYLSPVRRTTSDAASRTTAGRRAGPGRKPPARLGRAGRPPAGRPLVGAAEERERRARKDLQVDQRRAVLDVPDVQLDPLLPRHRRAAVDLRPAGDPRLDL